MTTAEERAYELSMIVELVNASELSSIRRVVCGILKIIEDPKSTAKDLKELIEVDPPLTARVLTRANSAHYAPRSEITDIEQAVIWLGFDTLKELALNQKVCELFLEEVTYQGYSRAELWRHSVAVALACKAVYRKEFRRRGDSIYAAGLLHDLGIIVEDQFIHETFMRVLDRRAEEKGALSSVETEVFGYSHADVARVVAEDWGLPTETQVSLGFHHTPKATPPGFSRNVCTVYLANELCSRFGLGFVDDGSKDDALFAYCLGATKLDERSLELITRDVEQDLASMEKEGLI